MLQNYGKQQEQARIDFCFSLIMISIMISFSKLVLYLTKQKKQKP
jgi:hypothetical protein